MELLTAAWGGLSSPPTTNPLGISYVLSPLLPPAWSRRRPKYSQKMKVHYWESDLSQASQLKNTQSTNMRKKSFFCRSLSSSFTRSMCSKNSILWTWLKCLGLRPSRKTSYCGSTITPNNTTRSPGKCRPKMEYKCFSCWLKKWRSNGMQNLNGSYAGKSYRIGLSLPFTLNTRFRAK